MQMSDVIWKRNACCTTTAYALMICEEIIWIHSAVSEELCGNEIRHRFYPETIQTIHMQTKWAVIWKWDGLDSSKDYPRLNSEDFITNYPAIWQQFSNNKISLTQLIMQMSDVIWKRNACCTTTSHPLSYLKIAHSGYGGVARKRNIGTIADQIITFN
jgi:hypothetical protein